MPIKAKVTIKQGNKLVAEGILICPVAGGGHTYDQDKVLEDLFNIERYINTQGAYRCHIEAPYMETP